VRARDVPQRRHCDQRELSAWRCPSLLMESMERSIAMASASRPPRAVRANSPLRSSPPCQAGFFVLIGERDAANHNGAGNLRPAIPWRFMIYRIHDGSMRNSLSTPCPSADVVLMLSDSAPQAHAVSSRASNANGRSDVKRSMHWVVARLASALSTETEVAQ
jgi:hypothetical protein